MRQAAGDDVISVLRSPTLELCFFRFASLLWGLWLPGTVRAVPGSGRKRNAEAETRVRRRLASRPHWPDPRGVGHRVDTCWARFKYIPWYQNALERTI